MFVNLTPHEITIVDELRSLVLRIPPSGQVARLAVSRQAWREPIDGVTVYETVYGAVEGLPSRESSPLRENSDCNTFYYIVSALVLAQVRDERGDVFAPGELVRDERGQPIGCVGLSR
jgi:hypothetical protein